MEATNTPRKSKYLNSILTRTCFFFKWDILRFKNSRFMISLLMFYRLRCHICFLLQVFLKLVLRLHLLLQFVILLTLPSNILFSFPLRLHDADFFSDLWFFGLVFVDSFSSFLVF